MNAILLAFIGGSIVGAFVVAVVTITTVREAQRTAEAYFQRYLASTRSLQARLSQEEQEVRRQRGGGR
jgi:hypothetical protein